MVRLTFLTIALLSCLSFAHSSHHHHHHPRRLQVDGGTRTHSRRANLARCKKPSNSQLVASRTSKSASPSASPSPSGASVSSTKPSTGNGCYPALGFKKPDDLPEVSNWWCSEDTEYAFAGFSYDISACQSASQLDKEFGVMRNTHNARYVRLYGACDQGGYYNKIIDAAYAHTLGVHALIWFGFDGNDAYKGRRDALTKILLENPKAKYVTRVVQFGSEALFDSDISPSQLATEINNLKKKLAGTGIQVTTSDMAYGFSKYGGQAQQVFDAADVIDGHMLPFFANNFKGAGSSWPIVLNDMKYFIKHANGKKIMLTENGMPWAVTDSSMDPTNKAATTSKSTAQAYYSLLDKNCEYFKSVPGGGTYWFAHMFSDNQQEGYGVLDGSLKANYQFSPRTSC